MKIGTVAFIAMLFLTQGVQARIGETLEQAKQRYGAPLKIETGKYPSQGRLWFKLEGYWIVADLLDDKVQHIEYSNQDAQHLFAPLEEKEIETFLSANGEGKKWIALNMTEGKGWRREDNRYRAAYFDQDGVRMLWISTKEFLEKEVKHTAEQERKRLEKF